jgi:hypothetical protein
MSIILKYNYTEIFSEVESEYGLSRIQFLPKEDIMSVFRIRRLCISLAFIERD